MSPSPTMWRVPGLLATAGLSALLTMAYIVYIGRTLGPAEYADFAAALSVIYLVGTALSPLTPVVGRLTARYAARGEVGAVSALRAQINARISGAVGVIALAMLVVTPAVARLLKFRSSASLLLSMGAVALYALLSVDRAVAQGLLRFRLYNANMLLESVLRAGSVFVVLRFWPSAAVATGSYVFGLGAAEIALAASLRSRMRNAPGERVDWHEVRRLTQPIVVVALAIACFQNIDMLIVKYFFATSETGIYGAATALARTTGVIFAPLYVLAGPTLTRLHESGSSIFLSTAKLAGFFLALAAIPLTAFTVWPGEIVGLLYGVKFAGAAILLAPLAGVAVVSFTGLMLSQALLTIGHARFMYVYGAAIVMQILALVWLHDGFVQVLAALWAVQSTVTIIVAGYFLAAWRNEKSKQTESRSPDA